MVGVWALREAYEFTPGFDFEQTAEAAWGQMFRVPPGTRISGIAWYRGSTGTDAPSSLSLWEQNGALRMLHAFDVPDNGSIGWQEKDLTDTPLDIVYNGAQIMASAYGGTGVHRTYGSQSAPLRGALGVNVLEQAGFWQLSIGDNHPESVHTGTIQGLDIRTEIIPIASPDVVAANVEYELSRWLSESGDHYDDSRLPFIAGQAAGANTAAQANSTAIEAVKTDTQSLLDRLTEAWRDTVASNTNGIPGFLTAWDNFYTQFITITAPQVADLVEAVGEFTGISVLVYLANLIRWANGINQPPQLAEGPDWELLDETDFTDNLLWPVEADVYRVTLSAFDPAGTSEPVGTETRHAYLGKWCPFNVQFSGEWHYFNTTSADLALGGRMPGLGLILYRPGTGHVQAWRRTEAL